MQQKLNLSSFQSLASGLIETRPSSYLRAPALTTPSGRGTPPFQHLVHSRKLLVRVETFGCQPPEFLRALIVINSMSCCTTPLYPVIQFNRELDLSSSAHWIISAVYSCLRIPSPKVIIPFVPDAVPARAFILWT